MTTTEASLRLQVLARLEEAQRNGEPVELMRGVMFGKKLKQALKLSGPPSRICKALKDLVGTGEVIKEKVGQGIIAYGSHRNINADVVRYTVPH